MTLTMRHIYIYIYILIFTTEGFLEAATESWPEWDLNPRKIKVSKQQTQVSNY